MSYKICVEYLSEEGEPDSYYLSLQTEKIFFSIEEPYCYTENQIDSLLERKEGHGIGGGGNNNDWTLYAHDGLFHLEYEISGMRKGSTFDWTVEDEKPILEMLDLMKKINTCQSFNILIKK
jgi:hypothetical protein